MPFCEPLFRDRCDAGRQLAAALTTYRENKPIVLALPRGGVPVAFEAAKALAAPLDVLLVRKIGAPGHEELALGAIVDGEDPQLVLNEDVVRTVAPRPGYIEAEKERQLAEIERRRQQYVGERPPLSATGRVALVIDDGIATGATVKAALRGVARHDPARLVLAVPIAPADSLADLKAECDDIVCLATPEPFYAVGPHYRDFRQTTDEEVIRLLADARQWSNAEPSSAPPGWRRGPTIMT